MSAEVVNLRARRKEAARRAARLRADANAAKFGRTKAEKELERARADRARRGLDAHLREAGHAEGGEEPRR
jgi:hypothetical protein